jgi:hypothetical protein
MAYLQSWVEIVVISLFAVTVLLWTTIIVSVLQ